MEEKTEELNPDDYTDKYNALCKFLDCELDEIEESDWGNCDELFNYGREQYMVLEDSEADSAWDKALDSYLDEVVYPEIPERHHFFIDDELWKREAKHNGRGHSLASYDG